MLFFRFLKKNFTEVLASPMSALEEGSLFFEGEGLLYNALRRLAADLERRNIDYCVIGGVALNQHGYHRFTTDIDILLSPEGLEQFRNKLVGVGYKSKFQGTLKKTFLALPEEVPVDIIKSGEYPGYDKQKPVRFPAPHQVSVVISGLKTICLESLIELKLASGISGDIYRLKDLADVVALIRIKNLDESFASRLSPYVQPKFLELQSKVKESRGKDQEQ